MIDCFIFYNELDLLQYRLNVLNDVIDYFVIVESRHTFVGKEKPLYFNENKHLFEKYNNKIIHIIVDLPYKCTNVPSEVWENEFFQRNAISQGIESLESKIIPKDIIITDVDEIPDPNILSQMKMIPEIDIYSFAMDFYYYNLNTKFGCFWTFPKILSYKKYLEYKESNITCNDIRRMNCNCIKGGWHLSYFGDASFIKNKIENFSHQEYNTDEYTDLSKIEKRIENCKDLYDRDSNITHISIKDNTYLPPQYEHLNHLFNFYIKS
jgi:beta-1,4-mannosyl-glycoprotein beta-1,4-N-acetylglucosaminyltransferase